MKGIFITFEGTEGSGKTTIIENIERDLRDKGYLVVKTREPGGSKISEEIRAIILNVKNVEMDAITEALLYAASRRQHLKEVVIPYLDKGYIVLCDRYVDSSLAYQGYARGIGIEEVYQINQFATENLMPDLTLYIDVSPEIGLKRVQKRSDKQDRLDLESMQFHQNVYDGYQILAKKFSDRIKVISGKEELSNVYENVKNEIFSFLELYK